MHYSNPGYLKLLGVHCKEQFTVAELEKAISPRCILKQNKRHMSTEIAVTLLNMHEWIETTTRLREVSDEFNASNE